MAEKTAHHKKLGQFLATAICGNDILSSSLYVSGIAAIFAGIYAPLVLLAVALVLFFYKSVYREVVEALPINGGAYNALLNGTVKTLAATAGVMTILSYVATAVISAKTAVEYLFKFVEQLVGNEQLLQSLIIPLVILILLGFAPLVANGVKDSAYVAAGIFAFHLVTLTAFIAFGFYKISTGHSVFTFNLIETSNIILRSHGVLPMLFLAFSASLLGVSGFESSANFVEEQGDGVFQKTLRNMLIGVAIFNPLIALVVLNMATMPEITLAKDFILAEVASNIGGLPFLALISIDAFLVLCGAVLTSYVGVSGLIKRMSLDECLPSYLLKQNDKGASPRILFAFFLLCSSILVATRGNLLSLAGVYAMSFLSVMTLFAIGNLILRQTRPELKRTYSAPVIYVLLAACITLIGILGNAALDPRNILFFLLYFIPSVGLVMAVIYKANLARTLAKMFAFNPTVHEFFNHLHRRFVENTVYVFVHRVDRLYDILDYIHKNESAIHIHLIHCGDDKTQLVRLRELIPSLREAGVYPHFKLYVDYLPEDFGPHAVDVYSKRRHIPKNRIFIGSIHHSHDFDYDELGGVRIIS